MTDLEERIRGQLLAATIMAPGYDRQAQNYYDRYVASGSMDVFKRFVEAYAKAGQCREIIRVLKEILDED